MPTNTFDRRIDIIELADKKNLIRFLESDKPARKLCNPVYTEEERKQSVALLKQFASIRGNACRLLL